MALEIRPCRAEEMKDYIRVVSLCLVQREDESGRLLKPEWTMCAFEDGKLVTAYAAWPLKVRFNGKPVLVAGVTSVATLPTHRRRGYLQRVTTEHFKHLYEHAKQPIAITNPSLATIYQRYGYGCISTRNSYTIEPRFLQFGYPLATPGTLQELPNSEKGAVEGIYQEFIAERTGYIHRLETPSLANWKRRIFAEPPLNSYLSTIVYQENDRPLSYIVYNAERQPKATHGFHLHLSIRDMAWLTAPSYQVLWNYLSNMDIASHISWDRVPSDDPLPHLILEPRMLHLHSIDGTYGRIIDVKRALTQRLYDIEATLTFEVIDDFCPWNQGCWKLEVSPSGSSIHHTKKPPQLRIPAGTLAMISFGQISPTEALRMGRLQAIKEDVLFLWDRAMHARYHPFCPDRF